MIFWDTVILNGFDIFSRCRVWLFAHEAFQNSIRHFPNGWSNVAWKKSSLLIPRSLNKIIKHGTVKVKMFSRIIFQATLEGHCGVLRCNWMAESPVLPSDMTLEGVVPCPKGKRFVGWKISTFLIGEVWHFQIESWRMQIVAGTTFFCNDFCNKNPACIVWVWRPPEACNSM